jgi:hypothetical protein
MQMREMAMRGLANFSGSGVRGDGAAHTAAHGGAERDRTADLLVANEALSQLSYSPHPACAA